MEEVKIDKQVALCALEVPRFLGDANLAPNVLSGPFAGSSFPKCLLYTQVKGLTLASSGPSSSIQSRFLLRSVGKRWKGTLGSLALGLPQTIQRSPGITTILYYMYLPLIFRLER